MNEEKKHYQLATLYLLNRKEQPAIQNIEEQQIERCDQYIEKYNSLVNELAPQDISISVPANELDRHLNLLEKKYLDYMDSDSYQKLCEALTGLNKWKALKSELTSLSD